MARNHFSGDPLGEQKIALERLIKKTTDALDAARGVGLNAGGNADTAQIFTTGYGGGVTKTAEIWDLSIFDGEDIWSA